MRIVIKETTTIGSKLREFAAYEETDGVMRGHSTISCEDGVWFGRIGTRRLPDYLENLPAMADDFGAGFDVTDQRLEAVREWINAEYREAYDLIYTEHPWLLDASHSETMGYVRQIA